MSTYQAITLNEIPPVERDRIAAACFEASLLGHPLFGRLSHRYYEQYAGPGHVTLDTVVLLGNRPILFMPLSGFGHQLSYFGSPTRAFPVPMDCTPDAEAFDALIVSTTGRAAGSFKELWMVEDARVGGNVSRREECLTAISDLDVPEATLRSGLRKSYKSLVNWGMRNLDATVLDRARPDYAAFCEMRDFHRSIAGRATRADSTWDLQFEMIASGEAFAVLSHLKGRLVAASLVIFSKRSAYYGVGIYDRELMADGKPVGHSSVFRAMLLARSLGLQTFVLGDVTPRADSKLDSIAMFKKGFASRIVPESHVAVALH